MASTSVSVEEFDRPETSSVEGKFIRVIVADTQAIFRAGLRKIFAVEDDIRVVGQAETLAQTLTSAKRFSGEVLIFESALAENPAEAVTELLRQSSTMRLVVLTPDANQEQTLELFRRGAHGIVSREVEPELLLDCIRKVANGEPWLDNRGIRWVLDAYRTQGTRPLPARSKVQLTPKRVADCRLRHSGNEEQRDRNPRGHH